MHKYPGPARVVAGRKAGAEPMKSEPWLRAGGGRQEKTFSTLLCFGIPDGESAMSRTVSLPAAIGARMILEGRITDRGVLIPVKPSIYEPILHELEVGADIMFNENTRSLRNTPP